jgi:hypothetical protein
VAMRSIFIFLLKDLATTKSFQNYLMVIRSFFYTAWKCGGH